MPGTNDAVNQIKQRLDILEIIGERIKLRRSGHGYIGLCPFHHEDTPSFHVYPDTQSYYCFGCHNGGNIFTFTMKTEGLDFSQALILLASRAGVNLNSSDKKKLSIYDVLEKAENFFENCLKAPEGSIARAYMKKRNLNNNDADLFSLGYAPGSWDALVRNLRQSGISDRQIINAGLAVENKNGGIYDRFRGRLIFPVKDIAGRVIAFGGRLIDGEGAKYINSPESDVYSKRNNLYLLHEARKSIREKSRSILVEGYMDAARLHKSGFTETVASLGTSLTSEQAELLSRFADTCYICYDSDTAGQDATIRGMYILQQQGLDVKVINIPEGKDPDEFLNSNPPELFENAITQAKPLILQHLESVKKFFNTPGLYKNGINSFFEGISKLDNQEITRYTNQLCSALAISPTELQEKIDSFRDARKNSQEASISLNSETEDEKYNDTKISQFEAAVCALLWRNPKLRMKITPEEAINIIKSDEASETVMAILTDNPDSLESRWLSLGETEPFKLIAEGEYFCQQFVNTQEKILPPEEIWKIIIGDLKKFYAKKRIKEIRTKMSHGQATDNDMKELSELCIISQE